MRADRIVVITGAGGDTGKLAAERFLANGDTVIATDLSEDSLIRLRGAKLHCIAGDITRVSDCQRVAQFAKKIGGRVDVLVNVAEFQPILPFEVMGADDFRKVVDINLTGTFAMIQAMAPLLRGRGWGRIVNIGAPVYEAIADQVHYVAAKAGLSGLSRSLAHFFAAEGITVNLVTSGLPDTPSLDADMSWRIIVKQTQSRAIARDDEGEDVIGAIFFLASPDADFITGQTVSVDGRRQLKQRGLKVSASSK